MSVWCIREEKQHASAFKEMQRLPSELNFHVRLGALLHAITTQETSTVVHENNAVTSQETSIAIHENQAIASQETSTDRTQQFVFGAGLHKPFTVSPPIHQQPDSDAQIVFGTKVQLTLIGDLINKGRSNVDESLKVQEMSLKRKLVSVDELETTIALLNQDLEELRTFANKATTVSQQRTDASKRIKILAQEAQRLGEATARELEAHKDIILVREFSTSPQRFTLDFRSSSKRR
ncbi:MAG: hypothetical protein BYD32DRAFT_417317 [Podila humilis]|nr:MAG: hypothetical protein BYD32DRAFT_417317 [Podila humilis]